MVASINHVFVEYCFDDDDFDDEEVDFESSEEDYEGGSKFFTTLVFTAPPSPSISPVGTQPAAVLPPSCANSALAVVLAPSAPKAPMDANVLLAATASASPEPSPSTWHNLFASNCDTTSQQQTPNPSPALQGRDSVFHWLGPQMTTLLLITQRKIYLLIVFLIQSMLKLSLSLRKEPVPLTLEAGKLFSVEK
ncbi:hypothetical protein D5086_029500 [Populus alba]|uniref:Uncharacterized protein n=1 Tax=Populus alba TaxID=43335 RepID=A0ACC4ATX2_POPAL